MITKSGTFFALLALFCGADDQAGLVMNQELPKKKSEGMLQPITFKTSFFLLGEKI